MTPLCGSIVTYGWVNCNDASNILKHERVNCNKNTESTITCVTIDRDDTHRVQLATNLFFIFTSCLDVSVIIANFFSYWHCTYKQFYKCTPTATKHALHANFIYVHEKVILLGRSRLRALDVLVFAHGMQIQVAHALCKQGCRLISHTANKRLVTIEACYNCPRSPLHAQRTENTLCIISLYPSYEQKSNG